MAEASTILAAIQAAIGTVTGLVGKVQIGRPGRSALTPPCAWLAVASIQSAYGPDVSGFTRTMVLDVEIRVQAKSTTSDRTAVGLDTLSAVMVAVEADRSLGGHAIDVKMEGATFDGDELGVPGCAVVLLQVATWWFVGSGEGV